MKKAQATKIIRDLSWLSFNERVLQEAQDKTNPIYDRLRFLGIFSNNLDEFFRVRVAALSRMTKIGRQMKMHLEENPKQILDAIQKKVIAHQRNFDKTYAEIIKDLEKQHIFIKDEMQLDEKQTLFIKTYFNEKVRTQIVPLMIESILQMPLLHDKYIYLACVLGREDNPVMQRFALIEIPTKNLPRFVLLPATDNRKDIILLEDIIRWNLQNIFAAFEFDRFLGYVIKVTRDAELDLDNDINDNVIEVLERGIKNRKKGKATRFVYDRNIDPALLNYLIRRFNLSKTDNLIAGGRIHNFKDFMDFPAAVFEDKEPVRPSFVHPELVQPCRIMEVMHKKDILLHFPYHSFDSIIDLLREAAIDPFVESIRITCYRLSKDSKVINALLNALRNGKKVTAVIELRARFDEEANLAWKALLEDEGAKVVLGQPDRKVHAKLCLIKKRTFNKVREYAFFSTGNFNENTARYYGDHCLLTVNQKIIADIKRVFNFLENPELKKHALTNCKTLPVAPVNMRGVFMECIENEIQAAKNNLPASFTIKLNSLVDQILIDKIYEASEAGVKVNLIIRGVCCALTQKKSFKIPIHAISIIDEYLEHARVFVFHNQGKPRVFISSADWMVRNLAHRVETACPIFNKALKQELIDILNIQLSGNVKSRILDNHQKNYYLKTDKDGVKIRAQTEIYNYLLHQRKKD